MLQRLLTLMLALGLLGLISAGQVSAAPITYYIDQTIGRGSVVGTIETDGSLGVISASKILKFALTLNGVGASSTITSADSGVKSSGIDFTATAQNLFFNYSGTDRGYLLFQTNFFGGSKYYCDAAAGNFACFQGATVTPDFVFQPSTQNEPLIGNQIIATARTVSQVPLPASASLFGMALLACGAFGLKRDLGRRALRPFSEV